MITEVMDMLDQPRRQADRPIGENVCVSPEIGICWIDSRTSLAGIQS
jgi:hypothetical protein